MFARIVRMTLKTPAPEFTRVLENDIIPLLRKQKGFLDEIAFVCPEKKEAVAISLWERKEMAELYHKEVYPEVLKLLGKVLEGTPRFEIYEVTNSTFHKLAARVAA